MKTIDLNSDYDIHVQNGNLSVQHDSLNVVRQTIVNRLSLIKGETPDNLNNGLNLDIMFGNNVSHAGRVAEISRVIMLEPRVESIDDIDFKVDRKLRIGYFICHITVNIGGASQQTTVGFGV